MTKRKKGAAAIVVLLLILWLSYEPILEGAARYLVYPDNRQKSDVIVLLGGEQDGQRTRKAAELYKEGIAPLIIVSSGGQLSWRTTESREMVALLLELGIPAHAISKEEKSLSTYENALYTKELLQKSGRSVKRLTLVTDDWHTRRAVYVFQHVFAHTGIEIASVGSHQLRTVHFKKWWLDHESLQVIASEWARMLVYYVKY
ncbi:DUF218 domain-containing protein [Aneurinibacillus soli]|uniref:DUF218 domain-containing protein n=1 Tax=Aneurinibacillus soli TaxID=1500254 RepID=A0A0U5BCW1_9BACL|nr:YdcF family protein [Aneurinibacillus soli]PYE58470.1 DUF218 domain-containing protein [Aneurinibacillus soli]BAU29446.1 hypothetical protein CB4_03646 [Aneurinibacillus soli]